MPSERPPRTTFAAAVLASCPETITVPYCLVELVDWMAESGRAVTTDRGRFGSLDPVDADLRPRGTLLVVGVDTRESWQDHVDSWFGRSVSAELDLWPFARIGFDGSYAALWRDAGGKVWTVLLESEGHPTCVLGREPIDFLRLLSIGYEETSASECWDRTPQEVADDEGEELAPNEEFRTWVTQTFGVTIPDRASEIVTQPTRGEDGMSTDPWEREVDRILALP